MNEKLKQQLDAIRSWEDWDVKKKEIFGKPWERCDPDQAELELERDDILSDGVKWQPFSYPYKVDAEIIDLFEDAQVYVFSRLDPEGHSENTQNSQWFGRKCNHCKLWTKEISLNNCSFCGRELRKIPLNI
jgi:hypothetical protein